MNVIEEDKPIASEYESDARYTWPERWARLRKEITGLLQESDIAKSLDNVP